MGRKYVERVVGLNGETASLDPTLLARGYAARTQDCRIEGGVAKPRFGWGQLRAAQANFRESYGLKLMRVLASNGTMTEEFGSFEDLDAAPPSTTVKLFGRNPLSGTATPYTAGVTALDLHPSRWGLFAHGGYGYGFNKNGGAYGLFRYVPGDYDSVEPLAPPAAPVAAPTRTRIRDKDTNSTTTDKFVSFQNVSAAADVTVSGAASGGATKTIVNTGAEYVVCIQLAVKKTGMLVVEIVLNGATGPGVQDLSYNDIVLGLVQTPNATTVPLRFDVETLRRTLINNDASPVEFLLVNHARQSLPDDTADLGFSNFGANTDRTLRDNIVKYRVELNVTASSATVSGDNKIYIHGLQLGALNPELLPGRGWGTEGSMTFWAAYKNSTTGMVSAKGPSLSVPQSDWAWPDQYTRFIRVSVTDPAVAGVDKWILFSSYADVASEAGEVVRIHGEYALSSPDQYILLSNDEWALLPYESQGDWPTVDPSLVVAAFEHLESVHYGLTDGRVMISYTGDPLRWFSDTDTVTAIERQGQEFYMSPARNDVMRSGHGIETTAVYLGQRGVYVTNGAYPAEMGSPQRVAKCLGVVGARASCVWQDDEGVPGVAYLDTEYNFVFLRVLNALDVKRGYQAVESSIEVRDRIKRWLLNGEATPDVDRITVGVLAKADALVIKYKNREAVLRRQNLLNGRRPWEFYERRVATGHSTDVDVSDAYGVTALRSTGELDEFEYDRNNGFAARNGLLRDNGLAMPDAEYETRHSLDQRRRMARIAPLMVREQEGAEDAPEGFGRLPSVAVKVSIDGKSLLPIKKLPGRKWVDINSRAVGERFSVTHKLPEGSAGLRGYEIEYEPVAGRS